MSMKKLFVAISVIFVMSLAVFAYSQDKPETKKTDVKVEKVVECCRISGSATCQSKDGKCKCKIAGAVECKMDGAVEGESKGHEHGSAELKVKQAKVEGAGHEHSKCMKKSDKDGPEKK